MSKYRVALFASGSGTNAENFFRFFQTHSSIEICCLLSNNTKAYVLQRAKDHGVPSLVFNRADFYNKPDGETLHLTNWVDCVKTRKVPNAPAEAGVSSAAAAHMSNQAMRRGQVARWKTPT